MAAVLPAFLLAYSLQLAIVIAPLFAVVRVVAPQSATLRLRVWQAGLILALVLPATALVPITPVPSGAGTTLLSITSLSFEPPYGGEAGMTWPSWLVVVLFTGTALRAGWIGVGWLGLRRRFASALPQDDSRFADACAAVGVQARLLWRADVSHPFTYGSTAPVVVLPADLATASGASLRAIFVHELMHVRRRDWRWVIVEEAIRAVLWFHPAIWLLLGELRQAREEVVDRATVRLLGSRRSYLETLVALADRGDLCPAAALPFFRSRQLARRIAALAAEASMSRPRIVLSSTAVFAVSAVTLGAAARTFPLPPLSSELLRQGATAQPDAQSAVPGPIEQNAHSLSADALPPKRTRYVAPLLSKEAISANPAFTVRLVIDDSGRVVESRVESAKASATDKAAGKAAAEAVIAAVRQWQFERPARAPLAMTVVLKLDASGKGGDAPVIEQPVAIDVPSAEYPESARAKKIQGDVQIEAMLDATGHVTATKVVQSVSPEVDQAAVDAVRASVFRPGMRNGDPVPVTITMTMRFKLE